MRSSKPAARPGCLLCSKIGRYCALGALAIGCGATHEYTVLPASAAAIRAASSADEPLRVIVDTSSVHLPLAVSGANVAFTDVDRALAWSVERALLPLRPRLTAPSARPLELHVELLEARAEEVSGRLGVSMMARATLRQKSGNAYVAQTHAHARSSGVPGPNAGSDVVLQCTTQVARQLSGWLSGVIPE